MLTRNTQNSVWSFQKLTNRQIRGVHGNVRSKTQ